MTTDPQVTFQVLIDLDRDGAFTGDDDVTAYVQEISWNLGMSGAYQDVAAETRVQISFVNTDGRFTPENASGPYYGKLLPHRPVQVWIEGVLMVTGWTEPFTLKWQPGSLAYAQVVCVGAKKYLDEASATLELQENVTADTVLTLVFEQIGYPALLAGSWVLGVAGHSELGETTTLPELGLTTAFETGQHVFSYVGDNWKDARAYTIVRDLCAAERGRFFWTRAGVATFWNRQHLQTDITNDDTVSIDHNVRYAYGSQIQNAGRVRCHPRTLSGAGQTLYALTESITLAPGESQEFRALYGQADSDATVSGKDVVTPNTGDGSLAYTGSVDLVFVGDAQGATITLTNTGETSAVVSTLTIKGKKLTAYREEVVTAEDTTSITFYGRHEMTINALLLDTMSDAANIAAYELARRKDPRGVVDRLTLLHTDSAAKTRLLGRTIGDRINVVLSEYDHDADYFIIGEEHALKASGKNWRVTWVLEPAEGNNFWLLGESTFSELGTTTVLGL